MGFFGPSAQTLSTTAAKSPHASTLIDAHRHCIATASPLIDTRRNCIDTHRHFTCGLAACLLIDWRDGGEDLHTISMRCLLKEEAHHRDNQHEVKALLRRIERKPHLHSRCRMLTSINEAWTHANEPSPPMSRDATARKPRTASARSCREDVLLQACATGLRTSSPMQGQVHRALHASRDVPTCTGGSIRTSLRPRRPLRLRRTSSRTAHFEPLLHSK